ncbi:FtsW/RodA/SpoVE family cell cycle protein [Anaerovorax odorimutans]|uniref:FtsW/RodA/SpoVE family cell cycle protein n=1 Tax=Anaerovorax odorimutans TaxID=109327 RepID=UPI00040B8286|nr:FtsW/RodA/SpoVE family cell cycle protein [Anaerovorax odorimutans]
MDNILDIIEQLLNTVVVWSQNIGVKFGIFLSNYINPAEIYTLVFRWIIPVLAVMIFFRCISILLSNAGYNTVWGFLDIPNGYKIPIMHWENSIGRSKLSDIVINLPFISRSHAVITYSEGNWVVTDLGSKGGVFVNGNKVDNSEMVEDGDMVSLASADFLFHLSEPTQDKKENHFFNFFNLTKNINSGKTLLFILIFQLIGSIQIFLSSWEDKNTSILLTFLLFIIVECFYYLILKKYSKKYLELELIIFFLCGLNLLVVASAAPAFLFKQLIAIILGIIVYFILQVIINDLTRARKLKYILVVFSILLMLLNLILGESRFGARNWINLGFITFQPMEFVKIAFVLAGTATLDKLLTTRNLTAFIGFSGICIGALIIMSDLGTAVIFFGAFLVIAFMRSGDFRTIALICSGAILGAFVVVSFIPYIAARFEAWGHVWEFADSLGYQQTRTMIAIASGGFLGVGGGRGFLVNIPASDTDLVFGILCEEWGLIVGVTAVLIIVFLAIFAVFIIRGCKSSFYAIAASGAVSIYLMQTILNIFGSIDFLPLTGVTLPFISNGGSSMITSWALLAFVKAADDRYRPDKEVIYEENEDNIYEYDEYELDEEE